MTVSYMRFIPVRLLLLGPLPLLCHCSASPVIEDSTSPSATTGTTAPDPSTGSFGDPEKTPTTGIAGTTGTTSEPGTTTTMTNTTTMTGEPSLACGDGVVDPDEACDDGLANDNNAFCTESCQLNTCGDGHVFVNWELCDQGAANSDAYGSACGSQCTPGARCGDHILQPEHEQCDLGADNGAPKGDEQGIVCDASCDIQALRAFVTTQAFTGDLGGIEGADKKCRDAASAAGLALPYRFYAYLSTPDSPANARFPGPAAEARPYILVSGKKVADSHAALLLQGPLGEGFSVTESGASLYGARVATNTTPGGNSYAPDQHCMAWTAADPLLKVRVGLTFPANADDGQAWSSNAWWVSYFTLKCDKPLFHLYCLEI